MTGELRPAQGLAQGMVMTPRLQQAIKLLRLSNVELQALVERELESNPLLERAGRDGSDPPGGTRFDDAPPVRAANGGLDDVDGPGPALAGAKSLRRHLEEQIGLDVADPRERLICAWLIDSLDEAGYFTGDAGRIARRLGCSPARVESALARLHACEPVGVGARSLRECLALQLAERGRIDAPMERLLDNLDLIARRDLDALAARCGLDEEGVRERVRRIRALNPRPGASFDTAPAPTVTPDVHARRTRRGWAVTLDPESAPQLAIDKRYGALARRGVRGARGGDSRCAEDRAWVRENLRSADWLLRALEQRAATILAVSRELVRAQREFLEKGVRCLRPLTLRDVAGRLDIHESTVSRVTSDKFMSTPRGVFGLKDFFSGAIPAADGDGGHAAGSVRHRIRELIDAEPVPQVLSDDRIAVLLRESGIVIARRTIAKYRESLNIPSSVQRRRLKAARL